MNDAESDQEYPRIDPDEAPSGDPQGDPQGWPAGKADTGKRVVAVVIDAALAIVVGMIPFIGGIIAAAYWVLRDGMDLDFMDHRSVGKKLTKLRPVKADGSQLEMMDSVTRNWMFGLGGVIQTLMFIPILGWLLIIPVSLVALGFGLAELFKVLTDPEGRRFGDIWAQTKVIQVED